MGNIIAPRPPIIKTFGLSIEAGRAPVFPVSAIADRNAVKILIARSEVSDRKQVVQSEIQD